MIGKLLSALALTAAGLAFVAESEESAAPAETNAAIASAPTPPAAAVPLVERPIFVSVPDTFSTLQRAPVLFSHDAHTEALKGEGCDTCHPRQGNVVEFSYPKERRETDQKAWMNAYHDACMGCHAQRAGKGLKTGPATCGECHNEKHAYRPPAYTPVTPEYYEGLRDPYHKDCLACHRKTDEKLGHAKDLDWKRFYVTEKARIETVWPKKVFDYYLHDKHQKTLEKKCELCHYLPPDVKQKLAAAGKEPTGQDWLKTEEPGKSWKTKESAHARCLNCHLDRQRAKQPAGPVACKECHTGQQRPLADLQFIPPPDYGNKDRLLILATNACLAAVPFSHKAHIAASRSCNECHHDTLESCQTCHTLKGAKEGNFVTLAEAYHAPASTWSCVGCHEREKQAPDCAGCHALQRQGLDASTCAACHTGELASLDVKRVAPDPATLLPKDLKDEFKITILEKEYDAATIKHTDIARKLTEVVNKSWLAKYFHKSETTLCAGCHHATPIEKNKPVPACVNCHSARSDPSARVPTLLGAYHQQCLGCHKRMGHPEQRMPQDCAGCHKEKKKGT